MKKDTEALILENVSEALNGIMSEHRAAARAAKRTSVRAEIRLEEIRERANSRLKGLRRAVAVPCIPSIEELRRKLLPTVLAGWENVTLSDDALELDIVVPPPRKAHAR